MISGDRYNSSRPHLIRRSNVITYPTNKLFFLETLETIPGATWIHGAFPGSDSRKMI